MQDTGAVQLQLMSQAPEHILEQKLDEAEAVNTHLREQLFALQAQRVRMQGYLFTVKPYPIGLFSSAWEMRYFSLADSCLKCFVSEQTMALIPLMEILVQGYSLHWEGKKRKKFWTFGLKDSAGYVILRLSCEDRASAVKWMTSLEAAGASGSSTIHIARVRSMPVPGSTCEESQAKTTSTEAMEFPETVTTPTEKQKHIRRSMMGSTPVHDKARASVLSSERLFQHPHPGLLNLGTVILLAANFRLVLENVFKYGLRVNPLRWIELLLWGSSQPLMFCWPVLGLCSYLAYLIEKLAIRFLNKHEGMHKKSDAVSPVLRRERWIVALHVWNVSFCFLVPLWLVFISIRSVLPSFVLTFVTLIVCMKLISYAHCNADLRRARFTDEVHDSSPSSSICSYPRNVTARNLTYFLFAPTLTYQISYPKTDRIRGKWLLRRCGELALALSLLVAIIDQYIIPSVENSMLPLKNRNFVALVERILKLSLPVLYAWLTMFYIFFHLWLNILAEAMKFGDREFYLDWWNALNLGDYWKTWNTPVHKWMLRTVYYPAIRHGSCLRTGMSLSACARAGLERSTAMLLVFFISALVHEVAVTVPLKFSNTFPWSFVGMLAQVPLILFSEFLQKKVGDRWGNMIFWVSFCFLGQPICLLNYYYDWIHASS